MIYIFLADGFEEIEALCPADLLRRAELDVTLVGVTGKTVHGAHGIDVISDITLQEFEQADTSDVQMAILPGGKTGTENLRASDTVCTFIRKMYDDNKFIAAICAAPSILGSLGLLDGRRATCYPGFEQSFGGGTYTGEAVTCDGNIITAKGMGVSLSFGLTLIEKLKGFQCAMKIKQSLMTRD